ncbi:hypothetical protein BC829DRAFT_436360 [Chytridium lagenaria]|nr:hypothetical protein BC829DRAFT_436360 [Chytridium lagenaria]
MGSSDTNVTAVTAGDFKASIVVSSIYAIFVISSTALLITRRHHHEITTISCTLTTIQSISNLIFVTTVLLFDANLHTFPGFILFWVTSLFVLLWILSIVAKTIRFLILHSWNQARLGFSEDAFQRAKVYWPDSKNGSFSRNGAKDLTNALSTHRLTVLPQASKQPSQSTTEMLHLLKLLGYNPEDPTSELWLNPEGSVNRKITRMMMVAMTVQFFSTFLLQVLLPDPVRISPMAKGQMEIKNLFKTHLLSSYVEVGIVVFDETVKGCYRHPHRSRPHPRRRHPIFVLWFISIFTRRGPTHALSGTYLVFALLLLTHITSVILPIYNSYRIDRLIRIRPSPSSPPLLRTSRFGNRKHMFQRTPSLTRDEIPFTLESFQTKVLDVPTTFRQFKTFCATALSIESAVFHESHVFLKRAYAVLVKAGAVSFTGVPTFDAEVDTSTPSGAIAGQCLYLWETFVREGSPMEVKGVSAEAKDRVEEGLRSGVYSPDLFGEIARENVELMFATVFPKFLVAYNSKTLPSEDLS